MTKAELWKIYCDKNPQFADENATITMSAVGLKKLFDQTFEIGEKRGEELARTTVKPFGKGGLFGDIF